MIKVNKKDFPVFYNYKKKYGQDLCYFDSSATTLTPKCVINKIIEYYEKYGVSTGRTYSKHSYELSIKIESVRKKVSEFIGLKNYSTIFTSGATDSSNRIVIALLDLYKKPIIAVSKREHSSVLAPLIVLKNKNKIGLVFFHDENNLEEELKNKKVHAVFLQYQNNATGEHFNIKKTANFCLENNALLFVDISQSVGKEKIILPKGISGVFFSAHKMFGPKGVGCTVIKNDLLNILSPSVYGGGAISSIDVSSLVLSPDMSRYEPGTADYAGILALGEAIDYINSLNQGKTTLHIRELSSYLYQKLEKINGIKIISEKGSGILSFYSENIHPHDISHFLEDHGVVTRAGYICSELWVKEKTNNKPIVRISFHIYNTKKDVDFLYKNLRLILK